MEGNEEKELTVDELVSLPWHIVRLIISNFSPWDLLRFASSHPQFKALVQEQPKSHKSIESGTFSLELIRNGRLLYHTSAFIKYTEKMSLNRMKVKNKDTAYHANFFFQKNDDLKKDSYKILMTNAKVEQVMRARMEMIDWDFKAQELAYPDIKTLNELEEMIEKFSPSSVLLYKTLFFTKQDEFNRDVFLEFIASPKIHSLQCLYTYCTLPHLNYFTRVPIPKLRIQLQNSDDFQVFLSSFTEEIIQQWENNSREIDFIILKLPLTQNHGDNELENFLNFEINEMVRVLGYGRPGSFEGRGIDRRFKLIKRQDGVGLLLMTGALSVLLVRCDYNIRRNRGLGKMRECEELMNEVLKAARTMKHVSESTSKAQTVNETIPEPILDMGNLFGEVFVEMDEETIRKEREKEDERHAAVIKKHESILVDTMKKLIEFRKGIPVRELAIDMLWDEKAGEINANLLRRLNHDFNEGFANFNLNGYPNELLYKDRTMRSVDELIEEYLNTQKIPNLFDYWLW